MNDSLEPQLRQALAGDMTPKFLATLDADGRPNCVPVISITPYHDGTLIFGEFFMNKTHANLLVNNKVGVAVFNGAFEGWSLKGVFLGFETAGDRVEYINNTPLFRYNAYTTIRAAGSIRIEEVSPKWPLPKGRFLCEFLSLRALAVALRSPIRNDRKMPWTVQEKFTRMSAVRAAAFRDTDGFPRVFPLMGCVSAGPNRILLHDPLFRRYAAGLPAGTELAASVITTEPIAYQVKGAYAGRCTSVGIVDLTECYSASPPLLGERLDRPRSATERG